MDIQRLQIHQANKKISFNTLRGLVMPLVNYSNALEFHIVSHGDRFVKQAIKYHLLCIMLQIINIAVITHIDLDEVLTDYIKETN